MSNIRYNRIMRKLKRGIQKRIVEGAGISSSYVCEIFAGEDGKVKLDRWSTAKKISMVLDINPVFLLEAPLPKVIEQINKKSVSLGIVTNGLLEKI